jgi:hypothetical protein
MSVAFLMLVFEGFFSCIFDVRLTLMCKRRSIGVVKDAQSIERVWMVFYALEGKGNWVLVIGSKYTLTEDAISFFLFSKHRLFELILFFVKPGHLHNFVNS